MAVTRFGFWTVALSAALTLGACGDSESKDKDDKDAGTGRDASGGTFEFDAAGLLEFADLDDEVAGSACSVSADCKGQGGTCTQGVCTGLCEKDSNCGAGGRCVQPVPGLPGGCSKICSANSDCDDGLECREGFEFDDIIGELQNAGLTFDGGVSLSNIPKTCGPSLGTVELPDGVVGNACTSNAMCEPGECATNINLFETFPNGYCTGKCLEDSECGAGGVCYKDFVTASLKLDGRCLLSCTSNASCRSGQACRSSIILGDNRTYCLAPVPDAGTGGGASDAGTSTDP